MSVFRGGKSSLRPARGSSRAGLFLVLVATFTGVLVLTRSEAAAQSTETAQKMTSAPTGNAQHGKTVYTVVGCYECHGRDAQSGGRTGPKLGPNPLPFAAFIHQVRTPRNEMPPYTAKVLSDADLADIYAFLQSLPQPPKVDSVPLLQ